MARPALEADMLMDPEEAVQAGASAERGEHRVDRLLARQQAVVAMGRRLAVPPETSILMQEAAALLAETLDAEYSGVAEFLPDGESLRLRMTRREGDALEPTRSTREVSRSGVDSLVGYALECGEPVVVTDLFREKRFLDTFLVEHGIRSAVGVALRSGDRSFGSLAVCSERDRNFEDEDILLVEAIAHLVTTTAAWAEAEETLAVERRLAAGVFETVDALVLMLDAKGQILLGNRACEKITGYSLEEMQGRDVRTVFSTDEERKDFGALLKELQKKRKPMAYEGWLLTKDTGQRRVSWSCDIVTHRDGSLESIIATGVDITRQREAEAEAARATEEARGATAAEEAKRAGQPGHEVAPAAFGRLPITGVGERRKRPRRSYPYRQMIAPVLDGALPAREKFTEVRCDDISGGGFSFLLPIPPSFDTLVVALGVAPKVTHLTAQVAYVNRVKRSGQRMFRIGCSYTGQAEY